MMNLRGCRRIHDSDSSDSIGRRRYAIAGNFGTTDRKAVVTQMGEKHREMPYTPRRPFIELSSEEIARRILFARQRDEWKRARLAAEGVIVGNRPLSTFLENH